MFICLAISPAPKPKADHFWLLLWWQLNKNGPMGLMLLNALLPGSGTFEGIGRTRYDLVGVAVSLLEEVCH